MAVLDGCCAELGSVTVPPGGIEASPASSLEVQIEQVCCGLVLGMQRVGDWRDGSDQF